MTYKEYEEWFIENIDLVKELGIMHPNSQLGKILHVALGSHRDEMAKLNERVALLESELKKKKRSRKMNG